MRRMMGVAQIHIVPPIGRKPDQATFRNQPPGAGFYPEANTAEALSGYLEVQRPKRNLLTLTHTHSNARTQASIMMSYRFHIPRSP